MQQPTCLNVRVRSVHDAHKLFHAVALGVLPMVRRRLDTEERRAVRSGNVYIWEERGRNAEATGIGIERWTDGIRWSASRVRDEFLLYQEKDHPTESDFLGTDPMLGPDLSASYAQNPIHKRLVKQTYSVFAQTAEGQRKWHLTAYFVPAYANQLLTVDDYPQLANLPVPEGLYTSAKLGKGRARDGQGNMPVLPTPSQPYPYYAPYQMSPVPDGYQNLPPPWAIPGQQMPRLDPSMASGSPGASSPVMAGPPTSSQNRPTYLPRHPIDTAALKAFTCK